VAVSTVTLAGNPVSACVMQIPAWGRAWADVHLTGDAALSGDVTLVIADVSYAMHVVAGGAGTDGTSRYRLVAGHGGWGNVIAEKGYANDAGVSVSNVLQDAAAACGETLGTLPATRLGVNYARAAGPASDSLSLLAPRGWYVDAAGVTQIGARATATYTGDGARTRVDFGADVIELAIEAVANLAPGVVVDGRAPATDVELELAGQRLTARVYAAPSTRSRRLEALRGLVLSLLPELRYAGVYEFRVVTQQGERLNLQPVRAATGLSELARVPVRPGVSGWRADVTPGEKVLVAFADRDPSRPMVVAHASADDTGWAPTLAELGAGGDFVALKSALDAIQQNLDTAASFGTPWGPTTPGNLAPAGAQASATRTKVT
jgi:hypothetical protein